MIAADLANAGRSRIRLAFGRSLSEIDGRMVYLARRRSEGEVLDALVQTGGNKRAALN